MQLLATLVVLAVVLQPCAAAGLTAGFTTYFYSDECPDGWTELPDAQGRLIVSVIDASISGLTLHDPLGDSEDRQHTHNFNGSMHLPVHNVAALECCNNQAAANGQVSTVGNTMAAASGLPFTQLLLCRLNADNASLGLPFGGVGYYDSPEPDCPKSWEPYKLSNGRTLVPGYSATSGVTVSSSPPLDNLEDRMHVHTFSVNVTVQQVEFAGIDSCCNENPGSAGTFLLQGDAELASTEIPYIQLLTCMDMEETFDVELPPNAMFFSPLIGCPDGWQLATTVSGRMLVALPEGGTNGLAFGGPSLLQAQTVEQAHSHILDGTVSPAPTGVGLASGCCAHGYAAAETYSFTALTQDTEPAFPFVMVPMCVQA